MVTYGEFSLERALRAVEKVRERLLRATGALEKAGIAYAVAGGNAVAAWVSRVDEGAVRFTKDVDIVLRRVDLPAAITAMQNAGFQCVQSFGVDMFIDGPSCKASDAVHILFAGEKVREDYAAPVADVDESERGDTFQVLQLESLVRMKLTSFRDRDRTHLRDMISVGLIDATWPARFTPALGQRLQELLDNPEG